MKFKVKSIVIKGGLTENIGCPESFDLYKQILYHLGYRQVESFINTCLMFIHFDHEKAGDTLFFFNEYNNKRC